MKTCTRCLAALPVSAFAKKRNTLDGLQYECRECCAIYARAWREKNAEKKRIADLAYAAAHREQAKQKTKDWVSRNRERKQSSDAAYRAENLEKIKTAQKAYRQKNAEQVKENKRRWRVANASRLREKRLAIYYAKAEENRAAARKWAQENPEKRKAQHALRKARKIRATPVWADLNKIAEFYAYASYLTETTGTQHHVDHIVPLRSTKVCGLHCEFNLQVLPAVENLRKRNNFEPG